MPKVPSRMTIYEPPAASYQVLDKPIVPNIVLPRGVICLKLKGFNNLEAVQFGVFIHNSRNEHTGHVLCKRLLELCHENDNHKFKYWCSVRDEQQSYSCRIQMSFSNEYIFTATVDDQYRVTIVRIIHEVPVNMEANIVNFKNEFQRITDNLVSSQKSHRSNADDVHRELMKIFPYISFTIICGELEAVSDSPLFFKKRVDDKSKNFELILLVDKIVQNRLVLVRGKIDGRFAWHYVLVGWSKIEEFLKLQKDAEVNIEDFGKSVQSGWDDFPSDEIRRSIESTYG